MLHRDALCPEKEASGNRTRVSTGTDDAGDSPQRLFVNERDNPVSRAFGHLHEETEDYHHADSEDKHRHLRKQHQHDTLAEQDEK